MRTFLLFELNEYPLPLITTSITIPPIPSNYPHYKPILKSFKEELHPLCIINFIRSKYDILKRHAMNYYDYSDTHPHQSVTLLQKQRKSVLIDNRFKLPQLYTRVEPTEHPLTIHCHPPMDAHTYSCLRALFGGKKRSSAINGGEQQERCLCAASPSTTSNGLPEQRTLTDDRDLP